jgi:hypothetical protein
MYAFIMFVIGVTRQSSEVLLSQIQIVERVCMFRARVLSPICSCPTFTGSERAQATRNHTMDFLKD